MYIAKKIDKLPKSETNKIFTSKKNINYGRQYILHTKSNGCNGKIISIKGSNDEYELFSIKYLNPYECSSKSYIPVEDFPPTIKQIKEEFGLLKGKQIKEFLTSKTFKPIATVDEDSIHLENTISNLSLKSYICPQDENYVLLTHNFTGWQQFLDGYIYREINDISVVEINDKNAVPYMLNNHYPLSHKMLLAEYENMMNSIKYIDYDISIPLLLYMFFGKNKSLFYQFNHNKRTFNPNDFLLHINSENKPDDNRSIINYISYLNKNFFSGTDVKLCFSSINAINKKIKLKIPGIQTEAEIRDIPVFKYMTSNNYNYCNKGTVTPSTLANILNSPIAYIFFNLSNVPQESINLKYILTSNSVIRNPFFDFSSISFSHLVTEYLCYISEKISLSITKDEKERKKGLIIDYQTNYNEMQLIIEKYVEYVFIKLADKNIDQTIKFVQLMKLDDYKRYLDNYYSTDKSKFQTDINVDFKKKTKSKSYDPYRGEHDDVDEIIDYAQEKYNECIINEYLKTPKYHTDYFDNLYKQSYQKLLSSSADKIKVKRYAFLLAMLESLKEYIGDCLPEKEDHFNDFYIKAHNVILNQCSTKSYIESNSLLRLFAEFIQNKIDDEIFDKNSGMESKLGWIDYKRNELLLRNTPIFHQKFDSYMHDKGELLGFNKTEFVRKILAENHLTNVRKAGTIERFDRTRKINGDKVEVLVINFEKLMSYLE